MKSCTSTDQGLYSSLPIMFHEQTPVEGIDGTKVRVVDTTEEFNASNGTITLNRLSYRNNIKSQYSTSTLYIMQLKFLCIQIVLKCMLSIRNGGVCFLFQHST